MKTSSQSINNQSIADWLRITPQESESLETWPPASALAPVPAVRPITRREARMARRVAITDLVACAGEVPSSRNMAVLLLERCGIETSHGTVNTDYRDLGLKPARQMSAGADTGQLTFGQPSDAREACKVSGLLRGV